MSKYCTKCGTKLSEDALFCTACGANQSANTEPNKIQSSPIASAINAEAPLANSIFQDTSFDKKKHRVDLLSLVIGGIVAIGVIAVLVIFFLNYSESQNKNNGLMDVNEIEQKLNEAYIKAWDGAMDDYEGVSDFNLEDADEETHDETFSCYAFGTEGDTIQHTVMGLVNNGKIIQIQSIFAVAGDSFNQLDSDTQAVLLSSVLFPVSIFEEDVVTIPDFHDFVYRMENLSDGTSRDKFRLVKGDIEYTYSGGSSESGTLYAFTIRHLPSFSEGFFGDNVTPDTTENEVDQYAVYDEKIGEYWQALTMGFDAFEAKYSCNCSSINALMVQYSYSYGAVIAYTLYDIDKNGTKELIFSDTNYIIDIYTVIDGKLHKIFEDCYFGDRARVHILSSGQLLTEGSSGASSASCEIYELYINAGILSLITTDSFYYDENGQDPNMSNSKHMKEKEYYDTLSKLLNESVFDYLEWTSIAENPAHDWYSAESDTAHTHIFSSWMDDNNGTTHSRSCSCGEKEIEAHTFNAGKVTKEPTDISTGIKTFTCTKCGATKTETIAKQQHTHSFGSWTSRDSSTHTRSCSCGEIESETHTFNAGKVTKEPTDKATGVKTFTCTKCGATKTETIAKLQHTHSFGAWTSSNSSTHARSCSCGEKESEAHTFNAGKVTKEPTETSYGIKTFTCADCGATETKDIPMLEHTHNYGAWTRSDCTYHSRYCDCGDVETDYHYFDSGVVTIEPTYSSEGLKTYTCYTCGATTTESIPKNAPPETSPPSVQETMDYYYQCVCNYCKHNDGAKHLVLYNGVKTDVIWDCSACGKNNWNYITYNW